MTCTRPTRAQQLIQASARRGIRIPAHTGQRMEGAGPVASRCSREHGGDRGAVLLAGQRRRPACVGVTGGERVASHRRRVDRDHDELHAARRTPAPRGRAPPASPGRCRDRSAGSGRATRSRRRSSRPPLVGPVGPRGSGQPAGDAQRAQRVGGGEAASAAPRQRMKPTHGQRRREHRAAPPAAPGRRSRARRGPTPGRVTSHRVPAVRWRRWRVIDRGTASASASAAVSE